MCTADYLRALCSELRAERLRLGWTCAQVARKVSPAVSKSTVGHWERGVREVGLTRVLGLCALYGVELSELTQRAERALEPLPEVGSAVAFVPSVWSGSSVGESGPGFGDGWQQAIDEYSGQDVKIT